MKYVRSKLRILCVKTWWTLLLRLCVCHVFYVNQETSKGSLNLITETSHSTFQAFCRLSNREIERLQSDRESRALAFLINVQINNGIYKIYWLAIKTEKDTGTPGEEQSSSKRITVKVCFEKKFFIFSGNTTNFCSWGVQAQIKTFYFSVEHRIKQNQHSCMATDPEH